jgi:hypothetical protein
MNSACPAKNDDSQTKGIILKITPGTKMRIYAEEGDIPGIYCT